VNGKPIPQELSVSLLTHPSQSLTARLGTIASHIAAFRPLTGWQVFLLGLLAVFGVPVAVGVALARAAAEDDVAAAGSPPPGDEPGPDPGPEPEPQPSARL
jgi:hypothetical protein